MTKSAEQIGRETLARLRDQAARNREAGNSWRNEIRAIINSHTGPQRLTAAIIQSRLQRWLSVRRVQEYMREINAESSASRSAVLHTATHEDRVLAEQ